MERLLPECLRRFARRGAHSAAIVYCAITMLGCSDFAAEEQARSQALPITNSEESEQDLAVVGLVSKGRVHCTGALIAPRLVLTAAHCVRDPVEVFFGSKRSDGQVVRIVGDWAYSDFRGSGSEQAPDVAVVVLALPAPWPLLAWAKHAPVLAAADAVRVVGFGALTPQEDAQGIKRTGTAAVLEMSNDTLELVGQPSQPCIGDSGGPVLLGSAAEERIVGVVTSGDAQCQGYARAHRTDAIDDFLTETVAAMDDCPDELNCLGRTSASTGAGCSQVRSSPGPASSWMVLAIVMLGAYRRTLLRRSGSLAFHTAACGRYRWR